MALKSLVVTDRYSLGTSAINLEEAGLSARPLRWIALYDGSDTPCRLVSSGRGVGVVRPGGRFVVVGAGFE
ncbi:hypothetical protein ACWD25_49335, partial [Streptomyces sp. NPDC002920]